MLDFLKKAFGKSLVDGPSKIIYDLGKFLFLFSIPYILTFFLTKLDENLTLKYWQIISFLLLFIVIIYKITNILLKKGIEKIKKDAYLDEATGLLNYKALNEDLEKAIKWSNTDDNFFSIILIDIDDFKNVNTNYGYEKADLVMSKLGETLKNDSRHTDKVYRYHKAGDEFIIIARLTNIQNASLAAERKRNWIAEMYFEIGESNTTQITVCCGVVSFNRLSDTKESLLERANNALQKAKNKQGKNNAVMIS